MQKDTFSERPFLNLTTQNKLIIFGILVSSAVIILTAWFVINNHQQANIETYHNFGRVVARSLATETANILTSNNTLDYKKKSLESIAKSIITHNKDLDLIIFRDKMGDIIYASEDITKADLKNKEKVFAPMFLENDFNKDQIGTVDVYLSGYTKKIMGQATRMSLFIIFFIAWGLLIFAVWLNTYLTTRNLSYIVEGVQRVSIGEFGYRVLSKDLWGEVKQLVEAFNDMSSRLRQYEERNIDQLTYERNKLEAILLSIANGVVVCDRCDEIILINTSASEMLGASSNEILSMKVQDYIDDDGNTCFKDLVTKFKNCPLESLETEPLKSQIKISNKTFNVTTSPIFDSHQEYLGYIFVLHDVTKELEIDKMKSAFITNVSHELRTPVTVLRSYIDTLAHYGDEFDEETKKEFFKTVDEHVKRLNDMVNSILDFSRLEKEEISLELYLEDLVPIIELTTKSIDKLAEDKEIKITKTFESNLPHVLINIEAMEKVMRNLISNAIKYTPKGGRIKIKAELDRTGKFLEVSVTDTGIGIHKNDLSKLFNRFYRVENKVHTETGTGLGLEIVKKAIEKQNGKVFVESEYQKGSTFGFVLPIPDNKE